MTTQEQNDNRKIYDMAMESRTTLDLHLKECGARYTQLTEDMQNNHERMDRRLDGIIVVMLSATGALVLGLFTIVGMLLHGGGKF